MLFAAILATSLTAANPMPPSTGPDAEAAAPLIGNTIEVRYGTALMVTSFAADGTFKMTSPDGVRSTGDWVADGRYMCWITKMPAAPPGRNIRCEAVIPGKKVGDTWTQIDTYGDKATVTLLAGDRLAAK